MYVCMYICMFMCTCMWTMCTYNCVFIYVPLCRVHTCTFVVLYTFYVHVSGLCAYMYICVYVNIYICVLISLVLYAHVSWLCMCANMYSCVCVCLHLYLWSLSMFPGRQNLHPLLISEKIFHKK